MADIHPTPLPQQISPELAQYYLNNGYGGQVNQPSSWKKMLLDIGLIFGGGALASGVGGAIAGGGAAATAGGGAAAGGVLPSTAIGSGFAAPIAGGSSGALASTLGTIAGGGGTVGGAGHFFSKLLSNPDTLGTIAQTGLGLYGQHSQNAANSAAAAALAKANADALAYLKQKDALREQQLAPFRQYGGQSLGMLSGLMQPPVPYGTVAPGAPSTLGGIARRG